MKINSISTDAVFIRLYKVASGVIVEFSHDWLLGLYVVLSLTVNFSLEES